MLDRTIVSGDLSRGIYLASMPLAVAEAQRMNRITLGCCQRENSCRIESSAKQEDGFFLSHSLKISNEESST
jgi:hypothetical protein